jgi:hypothetical protein
LVNKLLCSHCLNCVLQIYEKNPKSIGRFIT